MLVRLNMTNEEMMKKRKILFLLWGIIIVGVFLRLVLLFTSERGVDGDEACFGLMAKHIITNGEYPIYLWGAHYGGALISYLGAVIFLFLGLSAISLKLGNLFFVVFSILFVYLLAKKITNEKIGLLAALFMALPPSFVAIFSIRAYGGHAETLMFGPLILLLANRIFYGVGKYKNTFLTTETSQGIVLDPLTQSVKGEVSCKPKKDIFSYGLLGLICGIAFWISPAIVPFLLVVGTFVFLEYKRIFFSRKFFILVVFFLIGALPFIIYNIQHPFATFFRFGGRVLEMDRRMLEGYANPLFGFLEHIIFRLINIPHSLLSMPRLILPLWGVEEGASSILGSLGISVYIFFLFYLIYLLGKRFLTPQRMEFKIDMLFAFIFWEILFFCLAGLNRPRHLLVLYPVVVIFLAMSIFKLKAYSKILSMLCLSLIFSINLSSNIRLAQQGRISYKPLIQFLESENIFYGYATYHIANPIIFESNEEIIISVTADSGSDDRYPLYTQKVNSATDICFIFYSNTQSPLIFEEKIKKIGARYKKKEIPNFLIYYDFPKRIYPRDLDLPASSFILS